MTKFATLGEELATAVSGLPACIVEQCCGEYKTDLEEYFWYKPNVAQFGDKLIQVAGLALAAIYANQDRNQESYQSDAIFEDILRQVVFGRGYDRGHACALVQRGGFISIGSFGEVLQDSRIVTRFLEGTPARASNFLRAEVEHPVAFTLLTLLKGLRFLTLFNFGSDGNVTFCEKRIVSSPFLPWDGEKLIQFRRVIAGLPGQFEMEFYSGNTDEVLKHAASGLMVSQLTELAFQLQVPEAVFNGSASITSDKRPISIFPTSAHKQPELGHLAQLILLNSEESTRVRLLTEYGPRYSSEYVERHLSTPDGDVFFTNEIYMRCLEEDPVAVLESYFELETKDPRTFLRHLTEPDAMVDIERSIRMAIKEHKEKVEPFFCLPQHASESNHHNREFEARIAAQKIVRLMGFDIVEVMPVEDVVLYVQRVAALKEYVYKGEESSKAAKVKNGLLACCTMCEQILSFLYRFYSLLPYFELESPTGLSSDGNHKSDLLRREVARKGLKTLNDMFFGLAKDNTVQDAVCRLLGRNGIWPSGSEKAPQDAIGKLNDNRLYVHPQDGISPWSQTELLEGFLAFLDWLLDPTGLAISAKLDVADQYPLRIYPAVVALNLQTLTRSGITTLKYKLRTIDDAIVPVTLFTSQDVSIKSCYYGLAHYKDRFHHCWNNPVLIQSDALNMFNEKSPPTK